MEAKKAPANTGRKQPTAVSRMKQDYMRLKRDPLPYITAEPLPNNILEWHYVVKGPEDSPYHGGYYHGTLLFPREFPFKPPSIYMLTPNGRFKTNTRLCLSISDFHPDTWNPTWCVGTILTGLLSFMLESTPTLGSVETTIYEKQQYARKSLAFNLKNQNFRELFPEICEEINQRLDAQKQEQQLQQKHQEQLKQQQENAIAELAANHNNNANPNVIVNDEAGGNVANVGAVLPAALPIDAAAPNGGNCGYFNQSFYSNLVVVISFLIFALIVNYVLKTIHQE